MPLQTPEPSIRDEQNFVLNSSFCQEHNPYACVLSWETPAKLLFAFLQSCLSKLLLCTPNSLAPEWTFASRITTWWKLNWGVIVVLFDCLGKWQTNDDISLFILKNNFWELFLLLLFIFRIKYERFEKEH